MGREMTTRSAAKSGPATRLEEHVGGIVSSIGTKVGELRREQRLSLQQLAMRADVSAAAIHKIERSDMVPTVTTLLKIASALGRPASYFIEDGQASGPVAFTPSAERPSVYTPHSGLQLAGISGPYSPFRSAAAIATVDSGANSGTKLLTHPGEELVHVLDGALTFELAGERYELDPGDTLHFIGEQPHRWANDGASPARALWYVLRDS